MIALLLDIVRPGSSPDSTIAVAAVVAIVAGLLIAARREDRA